MATTYEKVIAVISRPPDLRKDFEVNNLLSWFTKKSELFRTLKTDLLFDIIKNLQYITRNKDELIIKQGDIGDCLYILLRGKVTIYIQYNKADDDGDKPTAAVISNKEQSIRQQLGTFVCPLGPGATFGEVALMSDDCIRTASIISDETSDLIVVDRELYNRSVKDVLKKEFEDKTTFIANNPFFQHWAPKYKKQLAMALIKDSYPYEGQIAKQGDEVESIYFILSGEVKVVCDPAQHKTQYHKLLAPPEDGLPHAEHKDEDEDDLVNKSMNGSLSAKEKGQEPSLPSKFRRKIVKKQPQEVCLLGVNESLGDIEVLMEMDTYMQTAICNLRTEVLILEMKHYERLLVKRNPRTIENMKEGLELRLTSRGTRHVEKCCPIFRTLQLKAEEYNEQRKLQTEARMNMHEKPTKHTRTMQEVYDSFIPPKGPLIDIYGPGTVFHHIRERDNAKRVRQQKRKGFGFNGMAPHGAAPGGGGAAGGGVSAGGPATPFSGGFRRHAVGSAGSDPSTSDPVLTQLENRMRMWLQNDPQQRGPVRVASLHRSTTEAEHLKPGAKVVLRPKASAEGSTRGDEDDMLMHTGHAWV